MAARNLSDKAADITVSADVVAALRSIISIIIYSILIFSVRRTAADVTIRNPAFVDCTVQISDEASETCRVGGILRIGTGDIYRSRIVLNIHLSACADVSRKPCRCLSGRNQILISRADGTAILNIDRTVINRISGRRACRIASGIVRF